MRCARGHSNPKGQASLLMVMLLLPAFTLLAFSINVGMLVHAKINLQSSADLAAYAGAAAQARVLNRISHLNYLMRMNYKSFIFKYYVLGNMGLKCFPGTPGETSPACAGRVNLDNDFDFKNPASNEADTFPGVPSVCAYYDNRANICQLNSELSRNLVVHNIPCVPGEATCPALNAQLERIRDIQRADCSAHGDINVKLLISWLYNTNPSNTGLPGLPAAQMVQGLMRDIGLVPANLLIDARIRTLTGYINRAAARNVDSRTITNLENAQDQAATERTVLAYRTAEGNLAAGGDGSDSWGTFEAGTLKMDELLPAGAQDAQMLSLSRVYPPDPGISVFYTFSGDNPLGGATSAGGLSCAAFLGEFSVSSRLLPLGVYKDPSTRVYYAVRLTAKAHLLFNPFGDDLELSAYAAAAPFGSRIGPKPDPQQYVKQYLVRVAEQGNSNPQPQPKLVPTIPFDTQGHAYSNAGLLKSLFATLGRDTGQSVTTDIAIRSIEAATGPDPIEIGQYNIPVEFRPGTPQSRGDNLFTSYFDLNNIYKMWAPLMPLSGQGGGTTSFRDQIISALEESFGSSGTTAAGSGNDVRSIVRGALGDGLEQYIGLLSSPPSANQNRIDYNALNVAAMPNPLKQSSLLAGIGAGSSANPRKVSMPTDLATSWFNSKWATLSGGNNRPLYTGAMAREGYSVKVIPFSGIIRGGQQMKTSNIPSLERAWTPVNPGDFGGNSASDVPQLTY